MLDQALSPRRATVAEMISLAAAFRRLKQRRGLCLVCRRPLPADALRRLCSATCSEEWDQVRAW